MAYKKLSETDQLLDIPSLRIYEVNDYTFEQSFDFLQRENPDAVVTAISSLSKTENKVDYNIAKAAQALKIRHLGILEAVYLSEELINQRFNFESHLYDSLIVAPDLNEIEMKLRTLNQLDNQFALIFSSSRNDKDTQVIQLLNELSQKFR